MATPDVSAIMVEARAAMERSHKLLGEMRSLREAVTLSVSEVKQSAASLAGFMSATMCMTGRVKPVLPTEPPASAVPEPVRVLDPKDEQALNLLTAREIEVLRLIGEGQRTKEIAFSLGITFKTAVTHRSNIMEKLGIHEGPRLVRFAIRTGITTP